MTSRVPYSVGFPPNSHTVPSQSLAISSSFLWLNCWTTPELRSRTSFLAFLFNRISTFTQFHPYSRLFPWTSGSDTQQPTGCLQLDVSLASESQHFHDQTVHSTYSNSCRSFSLISVSDGSILFVDEDKNFAVILDSFFIPYPKWDPQPMSWALHSTHILNVTISHGLHSSYPGPATMITQLDCEIASPVPACFHHWPDGQN